MEENEADEYEQYPPNNGKDWFRNACASLAKLDQVKNKVPVYNIGMNDARSVKAKTHSQPPTGRTNSQDHLNTTPTPPLTNTTLQKNGWGSNASIPELIKRQSERERTRPESAKVRRQNRPLSGKKTASRRPHSAKPGLPPAHPGKAEGPNEGPKEGGNFGVKGAKCDPLERPPEGIPCANFTCWTTAPSCTSKDIDRALMEVMKSQPGLCGVPPPPRGSPDLDHMLAKDGEKTAGTLDNMVQGILAEGAHSPRRPTPEPIKIGLTLPSEGIDVEASEDLDSERLINQIENHLNETEKHLTAKSSSSMVKQSWTFSPRPPSRIVDATPRDEDLGIVEDLDEEDHELDTIGAPPSSCPGNKSRSSAKGNVKFAEDKNVTVHITPRDCNSPSHRVSSAGKGSSHKGGVQSRVDSGLANGKVKGHRKVTDSSESLGSLRLGDDKVDRHRNLIANRAKCASKTRIATIEVNYCDDDQDREPPKKPPARKKNKDVETMMSKISLSDDSDADEDGNEENLNSSSNKIVSSSIGKNYYEIAKRAPPQKGIHQDHSDQLPTKNIEKVTKTLEFSDGEVRESTTKSALDAITHNIKEYKAPRPLSGKSADSANQQKNRPTSPVKQPPTNPDKPMKRAPPPERELERPGSRLGQFEDIDAGHKSGDEKDEGMLMKRRVTSAPTVRAKRTVSQTSTVENKNNSRPTSASKVKINNTRPSSAVEISRVNAAAKALKSESWVKPYDFAKGTTGGVTYKPPTKPFRPGRKGKHGTAKAPEVNEIWTQKRSVIYDTEGVQACKEMQERLQKGGTNIPLNTLARALLPPTEYNPPEVSTLRNPASLPTNPTDNLLSKPSVWLPDEHKRLQQAKRAVRLATESLRREERKASLMEWSEKARARAMARKRSKNLAVNLGISGSCT